MGAIVAARIVSPRALASWQVAFRAFEKSWNAALYSAMYSSIWRSTSTATSGGIPSFARNASEIALFSSAH